MNKRNGFRGLVLMCCVLFSVAQVDGAATNGTFSGADAGNNLFSDTDNWSQFPAPDGTTRPKLNSPVEAGTSVANPGQLDAAFNTLLPDGFGNAFVSPNASGSAVIEVLDGAEFKAINLSIGNGNVTSRSGQLTLKSGSSLNSLTPNNGTLTVGGVAGTASPANLIADAGVTEFTFANLKLGGSGVMTYNFGTDSVSTFTSEKSNGAATLLLDGMIQVDLSAGPADGTYTLIDSSHVDTTMTGALATWLTSEGGSFSSTGSYAGSNFEVLNGGTTEWTLSSDNGGGTLNLTVIPEPGTLGLVLLSSTVLLGIRRLRLD